MLQAERDQLVLQLAVQGVIALLDAVEAAVLEVSHDVGTADIAGSDTADQPGRPEVLERSHGLLDGRRGVLPVREVDVDVVGPQSSQARFDLASDRVGAQIAMDDVTLGVEEVVAPVGIPHEAALRGDHDLVPAPGDGSSHDLLGTPEPVCRSGVDERHALVHRGLDGRHRVDLISSAPHPAPDRPRPEPDHRGFDAGATVSSGLHRA